MNLVTPIKINPVPLLIKGYTYDAGNFAMGKNLNSISYGLECTFPCKTCNSSNTSVCLSCYHSTISTLIYLGQDKKCYKDCPDGFN